jgi:hypothetical protein
MPYYSRGAAFAIAVSFQIGVWSGKWTSLNFLIAAWSPNAVSLAPRPARWHRCLPGARCPSSRPDLAGYTSSLNSAILLRDCHGRLLFIYRPFQLPRRIAMPQPASRIVAMIALFFTIFGDRFVFRFADAYTVIALVSTGLSMPFILYRMARSRRVGEERSKRYPTSWIRNWVVMPLMAAMPAGLVFAAPLGWLFAAAAWYGGSVHHVRGCARGQHACPACVEGSTASPANSA